MFEARQQQQRGQEEYQAGQCHKRVAPHQPDRPGREPRSRFTARYSGFRPGKRARLREGLPLRQGPPAGHQ
ncbi:hypothetical protein ARTHROSP310_22330 [Arthrobacter sp. AD-310]